MGHMRPRDIACWETRRSVITSPARGPRLAAVATTKLRTIVYVDGFNLYYGCLKDSPQRWLDLQTLCRNMLRGDAKIVAIKYFTARVKPRSGNPNQAQRQQIYMRAHETLPVLTNPLRPLHHAHRDPATRPRAQGQAGLCGGLDDGGEGLRCQPRQPSADRRLPQTVRPRGGRLQRRGPQGARAVRPKRSQGARGGPESPSESKLGALAQAPATRLVLQATASSRPGGQSVPERAAGRAWHLPQATGLVGPENRKGRPEAASHPCRRGEQGGCPS